MEEVTRLVCLGKMMEEVTRLALSRKDDGGGHKVSFV